MFKAWFSKTEKRECSKCKKMHNQGWEDDVVFVCSMCGWKKGIPHMRERGQK